MAVEAGVWRGGEAAVVGAAMGVDAVGREDGRWEAADAVMVGGARAVAHMGAAGKAAVMAVDGMA